MLLNYRKMVSVIVSAFVLIMSTCAYAIGHETFLDELAESSRVKNEIITLDNPNIQLDVANGKIVIEEKPALLFMARLWLNLFEYETNTLEKKPEDTEAAAIYYAMEQGPAMLALAASEVEAVCYYLLLGVGKGSEKGNLFCIEWDTEEQTLREYTQIGTIKNCYTDEDIKNNRWYQMTLANALSWDYATEKMPDTALLIFCDTTGGFCAACQSVYWKEGSLETFPL